jgi:uncharacterized membrane protein
MTDEFSRPTQYGRPTARTSARHRKAGLGTSLWKPWRVACLVLLAALVPLRNVWAAEVLLLGILLLIPGLLLLRALRVPGAAIASFPAYVPCASLIVLLGSGLAVDLVGPLLGVAQPLRAGPLLAGIELWCIGLLIAGWRAGPETAIPWEWPKRHLSLLLPMLLPLLAAVGALRLNNGHGSTVAVIAVGACVATIVGALVISGRLDKTLLSIILYAVALALSWGFSLRGDLVYGFDIASEYHALQQTILTGVWHTSHVGDAYGAMLSVTVLPAELHAVSGISGLLIFKAVYPMIWAVFPVVVFDLASRVIDNGWAFAAAGITIAQEPFFQEMPALARQEIAMVLFAVLVAAILDGGLPRSSQLSLVVAFSLGMAVSHYSTTYFAIVMFAVALILQFGVSWFRTVPRFSPSMVVAVAVVAAGAAVWYGLVTRSASNLSEFISTGKEQGFNLLSGSGSLLSRYLQAGSSTTISPAEYAREVHAYYVAHVPFVHPLPDAAQPAYALRSPTTASLPARWQLGLSVSNDAQLLIEQLVNLVAALAALCLVLSKKSSVLARQVGLLGLGTLVLLAALRFSSTAAAAYNPERAFVQALVVLAVGLGWSFQTLAPAGRRRRLIALVASSAAVLAILIANSSGLVDAAFGSGTDTNMANSGADYNEFDMSTPELAAASWLSREAPPGQLIYADEYATLRLLAIMGNRPGMVPDITPLTINSQAWIYASRADVANRTAVSYFDGQYSYYAFPFGFLNANYDLAYTNGTSEVYYR